MVNLTITNNDISSVILEAGTGDFDPDSLLTVAGAVTVKSGTILARDSASLKYVVFAKGGVTNENGIPKAVLTEEVVSTGAGDLAIMPMINGKVREGRLVIDADGDATNIDNKVLDQLRDFGITPVPVNELNINDNQ